MRLSPKSAENPHPVKTGRKVDPKHCAHVKTPPAKKLVRKCKPCQFRWEVSPWSKVGSSSMSRYLQYLSPITKFCILIYFCLSFVCILCYSLSPANHANQIIYIATYSVLRVCSCYHSGHPPADAIVLHWRCYCCLLRVWLRLSQQSGPSTPQCSVGCGTGLATRNVTCSNGRTTANVCDVKHKPTNVKPCETHSFCRWSTARWNRVGSTI